MFFKIHYPQCSSSMEPELGSASITLTSKFHPSRNQFSTLFNLTMFINYLLFPVDFQAVSSVFNWTHSLNPGTPGLSQFPLIRRMPHSGTHIQDIFSTQTTWNYTCLCSSLFSNPFLFPHRAVKLKNYRKDWKYGQYQIEKPWSFDIKCVSINKILSIFCPQKLYFFLNHKALEKKKPPPWVAESPQWQRNNGIPYQVIDFCSASKIINHFTKF